MKKFFKYFFIAIFIICFICLVIYLNLLNSKNENPSVASTETTNTTNTNNGTDIPDVFSHNLPKDLIYATSSSSLTTSFRLNDLDELYNEMDLIIVGKVLDKKNGVFLEETGYASIPGTFKIEKILKGEYKEEDIVFYTNGGYCTIKEYVDAMSKTRPEKIKRIGFDTISEDDMQSKYLVFNTNYSKDFVVSNRYVLMLKKVNDKYICFSNYGMIEISLDEYINTFEDVKNLK